jgi:hypothetical protein
VLSAEEELHRERVGELDDCFVVNRDRGRGKGLNTILKNAEEVVSTNRAALLS